MDRPAPGPTIVWGFGNSSVGGGGGLGCRVSSAGTTEKYFRDRYGFGDVFSRGGLKDRSRCTTMRGEQMSELRAVVEMIVALGPNNPGIDAMFSNVRIGKKSLSTAHDGLVLFLDLQGSTEFK